MNQISLHPRGHFFLYWLLISLSLGEYFSFKLSPGNTGLIDYSVTLVFGVLMIYLTCLPVLLILVVLYSILGWWDN